MKKRGILNADLSRIVASMGHTDKLVICDSGLPIPKNSEIIDLALTTNIPRFLDTLNVILEELNIEGAVIAREMLNGKNGLYENTSKMLGAVKVKKVSHEKFKEMTRVKGNITFVRTGETTPYANVILISGVTF
ncbi:MAG TPA: D-ribose pyranase [Ignavibacteriaceae bacterium]|nr:D-ribose pyranase [Ignavibacteriaceae bacterium]